MEYGYNFDLLVTYVNTPPAEVQGVNDKITALEGVTDAVELETTDGFLLVESAQLSDLVRRLYQSDGQWSFYFNATLCCFGAALFDRYVRGLGADPQEYRDPDRETEAFETPI